MNKGNFLKKIKKENNCFSDIFFFDKNFALLGIISLQKLFQFCKNV